MTPIAPPWWETGIVYQFCPQSSHDNDSHKTRDIKGILSRLNYLQDLGVTILWLNPNSPSPMVDFGFDESDRAAIHPLFGPMKDVLALLDSVHQLGMKLVLSLNWRNPWAIQTMLKELRFWLKKGVDGFTMFRDGPEPHNRTWSTNLPEIHNTIRQIREILDEYGERILIGELWLPYRELMAYYGKNLDECHLPLNLALVQTPFTCQNITKLVDEYERALPQGGWPNWVLGSHDADRIASETRAGDANARIAQMLLLTLRGTPMMYSGDETGIVVQIADPRSTLQFVKQLIALRQQSFALNHGSYLSLPVFVQDVMAYLRTSEDENFLVALNFSDKEKLANLTSNSQKPQQIVLSTYLDRTEKVSLNPLKLRAHEGLILHMTW